MFYLMRNSPQIYTCVNTYNANGNHHRNGKLLIFLCSDCNDDEIKHSALRRSAVILMNLNGINYAHA